MCRTTYSSLQSSSILNYCGVWSVVELASLYTVTQAPLMVWVVWLSYDEQRSRHGRFKFESNLKALQVHSVWVVCMARWRQIAVHCQWPEFITASAGPMEPTWPTTPQECTGWAKKVSQRNLHITLSNNGRFSKILHYNILQEICNEQSLNIPPHLKCVATLPCEIFTS